MVCFSLSIVTRIFGFVYLIIFCFLFRKGILDEYSQITSLVTEEIVNVHKEIQTSVEQLDPTSEYSSFIEVHR